MLFMLCFSERNCLAVCSWLQKDIFGKTFELFVAVLTLRFFFIFHFLALSFFFVFLRYLFFADQLASVQHIELSFKHGLKSLT